MTLHALYGKNFNDIRHVRKYKFFFKNSSNKGFKQKYYFFKS